MIKKENLKRINEWLWEIPKEFNFRMRVPARIYASEKILEESIKDNSIEQLINTASLPGIVNYAIAMPDIHSGYGPPIGGVGAMSTENGVISPGFVGFDENCGVRLLKSGYREKDIKGSLNRLAEEIQREVPSGLGKGGKINLSFSQLDKVLKEGVSELVNQGYGKKEDIENCEEGGKMKEADPLFVSRRAKERGKNQLGTLGSGNHFCEIQKVSKIYEKETADIFGLFEDQIVVMIHTGSRGLGHQNCTDYLKLAQKSVLKHRINLPDKQLACFPFNSKEGKNFLKSMSCAANYAWANRQMITYNIRKAWERVLKKNFSLDLLYDVAHNIAKIEEHEVNGKKENLIVHRKGATRALPPGHPELSEKYKISGQPVLIPGSMGTSSFVLGGTGKSKEVWYTVNHGAGRAMSRHRAAKSASGKEVIERLREKGIIVKCKSMEGIAEESPLAYKDVDEVIKVVEGAGLGRKVAKLTPLAVIKGE
jgi:tRNA-splicing ligase RtcB (3'-phosphate/5'-hydroxy nucleic acid ligase)